MRRIHRASKPELSAPAAKQRAQRNYVVKAGVRDPRAQAFVFSKMKTMYGGKQIAEGDQIFVFASETEGGHGLVARGLVTKVEAVARKAGGARQTPRVSIWVKRTALANRTLGRTELKPWRGIHDGSGEAELDFKLYRQATNKIVALEEGATRFLLGHFSRP
jgi:hypothetical protein